MKTLITLMALVALAGCEARIETTNMIRSSSPTTEEVKNSIIYFKDDYGNCFASIGSMGSHGFVTVAIATIPCERMPQ